MKKLMTFTTFTLLSGATLYASDIAPGYRGPIDDTWWADSRIINAGYNNCLFPTQLGILARRSEIIGVGQVSDKQDAYFTITVDLALVGCTNGAVIVLHDGLENDDVFVTSERQNWFPTNNSRIVFAAYTNDFGRWKNGRMYWDYPQYPLTPKNILTNSTLRYLNRSWWYMDRDDGVLFTHFTNVLQAVRIDRNWTNYFYLSRDGAFSTSNRVREDSFWDMHDLVYFATLEQKLFIRADPLVDAELRDALNNLEYWNIGEPDPNEPDPDDEEKEEEEEKKEEGEEKWIMGEF